MSNSPIFPIPLSGEGRLIGETGDDEGLLTGNGDAFAEGKTDEGDAVDEDVREADEVNENLEK
jgi:hypothetical protein